MSHEEIRNDLAGCVGYAWRSFPSARHVAALLADRDRLSAEVEKLRGFAQAVMSEWPDVGCDGFDLQRYGEKFGLLEMQKRIAPCGEHCNCAEYETGEVECYRLTKLVKGDSAMGGAAVEGGKE
jgi:hypothetical protein